VVGGNLGVVKMTEDGREVSDIQIGESSTNRKGGYVSRIFGGGGRDPSI